MTPPELITSAAAADLLGIDRSTLSRWVADGRIKPFWQSPTTNGARLFRRREILALAAAEEAGA